MKAWRKRQSRRTFIVAASLAAMTVGLVFAVAAGGASLPGSTFEIDADANIKVDGAQPLALDWANVGEIRGVEAASGKTDDSYAGGEKENDACPAAGTGSIPPNKSDLKAFGAYHEAGATATDPGNLHVFWSRVQDPEGTTLMDFEFNKLNTDCDGAGPSKNVTRSVGDILLEYRIDQGGAVATLFRRSWLGTEWSDATTLGVTQAIGDINDSPIALADSDGLGAHTPRTFGEASFDLEQVFNPNECVSFGSAMLKSRSSDAFNSALKDFIAPINVNINNCATVIIRKQTVPQGDTQAFGFTKSFATIPASANTFSLADDGVKTMSTTLGSGLTVSEDAVASPYSFVSVSCANSTGVPLGAGGHSISGQTVTFTLNASTDILDCTFNNKLEQGAIKVTKSYKHAATPLDTTQAGVSFTVNGVTKQTDANGVACFDGLNFATYAVLETLPDGYSADQALSQNVTVDNNASCADAAYVGETVGFGNTPLTDVTITVNSQVPGGTMSTVDCDVDALDAASDATTGDIANNTEEDLEPQTINCEIVIDP